MPRLRRQRQARGDVTDFVSTAWRIAALAPRVADRARPAADWLTDRTSDGYSSSTLGTGSPGGDPGHSPTLAAIEDTRTITVRGQRLDLRTARLTIAQHLTGALSHLEAAQRILDAVPREASGVQAQTIDRELRHSRCEGWGPKHAICDENAVSGDNPKKNPHTSIVNGSVMRLCGPCYKAMWAETIDAGERGRISRDERGT